MAERGYDVVIVGGGITGCALAYVLARYTDIRSVALLEKYASLASLNTNARANSQTLHCGDIETNYALDKARQVKRIAEMIPRYAERVPEARRHLYTFPKMVMGVGDREVELIRQRHDQFAPEFPYMELWEKNRIAEIEPAVVTADGGLRPEPMIASGCTDKVCAVDFGALAESFARRAQTESRRTEVHLQTATSRIEARDGGFEVHTNRGLFRAPFVVVSAGGYSLLFAHEMGYGLDLSLFPVAGSFYFIPKKLNGKVYTVQSDKLPFAALHADPDIGVPDRSRIGPTALILPKLERFHRGTYWDFFKAFRPNAAVARVFWNLFRDREIRAYIMRNLLFEVPLLRKRLFLENARKIIPALRLDELQFARGFGGMRPQIIDRVHARLQLGEATISPGTGLIFNMTPSPGASTCLGNAYRDAREIVRYLGRNLDRERLVEELLDGDDLTWES